MSIEGMFATDAAAKVLLHTIGGPCQHGFNFMRGCKQWRII